MKAVQVMFDESLLQRLDDNDEVKASGRSAVLREIISDWLESRRQAQIAEQYRKAYTDGAGLGEEFEGWEEQGEWPPE